MVRFAGRMVWAPSAEWVGLKRFQTYWGMVGQQRVHIGEMGEQLGYRQVDLGRDQRQVRPGNRDTYWVVFLRRGIEHAWESFLRPRLR